MSERRTIRLQVRIDASGNREDHAYYMAHGGYTVSPRRHERALGARWGRRWRRLYAQRVADEGRRWDDRDAYERPTGPGRWP